MKKFFSFILFFVLFSAVAQAGVRSIAERGSTVGVRKHNARLMQGGSIQDEIPTDEEELRNYLIERSKDFDYTDLKKGDRLDDPSSFSSIAPQAPEKKTFWEQMYDKAMERATQNMEPQQELENIEYYSFTVDESEASTTESGSQMPIINVTLSDGMKFKVPAVEHIPLFSTQIEVLPNRMLKVYDKVVVVANGQKVQNGFIRFIRKRQKSNLAKMQIIPDRVTINGSEVPYELAELKDYYVIRPVKSFRLAEGVYVFEFRYFVDHSLWSLGDFYEFYWNVTGGHLNLLVTRVIASIKLPGREPAVKRYVLSGSNNQLSDRNAVMMNGEDNITGFMNLLPLRYGESMHVFITVPKVDFAPITLAQRIISFIEEYGDILFSAIYLLVVLVSCILSWRYICHRLKFKTVSLSSPLLVRSLWCGSADFKSAGCLFLDLFRKNVIDIQQQEGKLILVRKGAHVRGLSKFEQKIMKLLFSRKDSIYRVNSEQVKAKLIPLLKKETTLQMRKLGIRLSSMYIAFNILLFLLIELALWLWNPVGPFKLVFTWVNILLLIGMCLCWLSMDKKWLRYFSGFLLFDIICFSGFLLAIYMHWIAALMLMAGVCVAMIFNRKASGQDALLKNAVQSMRNLREFIVTQAESISMGRNFIVQQANIWALDLEDKFVENPKIKNSYRLDMINLLMKS